MSYRFRNIVRRLALFLTGASLSISSASGAQAHEETTSGGGNDIIHPLGRIDLRGEVEHEGHEDVYTLTLRVDQPVRLSEKWQLNLRVDLPYRVVHDDAEDSSDGGSGDVLLHAVLIRKLGEEHGFGAGTQLIVPTAGEDVHGRQQWRLRPIAAYRWPLPGFSEGTYFQLLARYDFSFAQQGHHSKTRELQVAPTIEFALPGEAFFTIFPKAEIRYDFVADEFFLPVNLEVGKKWGGVVGSVEVAKALTSGDHRPYDWKIEARIGLNF